uniref:integrin alpha-8-like isoform X2 n=1 Tax=Myxine glutinosa TaxID=7769 RepID=UPI00358E946F
MILRCCAALLSALLLVSAPSNAFNLASTGGYELDGPPGSYFGYSLDFYRPSGQKRWGMLVGAPRANTTQRLIVEGGAVYLCTWPTRDCKPLVFDNTGDRVMNISNVRRKVDYKSQQWFGASLRSYKSVVVACAPLYHWRTLKAVEEKDPVGTCYLAYNNFSKIAEYSPCRNSGGDPHGQGFCQGGFSVDLTKNGWVVLGGPGSFYWQGQLLSADLDAVLSSYDSKNIITAVPERRQTQPAQAVYDDSYLGYSVTVGEFTKDSQQEFVTGVPRGLKTLGYVGIIDSKTMLSIYNFTGEQMASYFGFTVAVTDVNEDGLDDVFVGAPLYMERGADGKLREVGRVYQYLQDHMPLNFRSSQTLTGSQTYARFGSAIAPLGDLDDDGYNDLAVGVPFGGENHGGLVYIYNGGREGLQSTASQVLKSHWPSGPNALPPSFGYALRGGADVDANGYPDLLVGAFGVSKAILYRARPVVRIEASVHVIPQIINPEVKNCKNPDTGKDFTCFTIEYSISAAGAAPEKLQVAISLYVDQLKQKGALKRVRLLESKEHAFHDTISMSSGYSPMKRQLQAFLEEEFGDKLTPIVVGLNLTLVEQQSSNKDDLQPVRSRHFPDRVSTQAHILLDCGDDNVCIPNLHLSVTTDQKNLYVGAENELRLLLHAINKGEGAYEAELQVSLPPEADYVGFTRTGQSTCAYKSLNATRTVICGLGNPMQSGADLKVELRFSVPKLLGDQDAVSFHIVINSSNSKNSVSNSVIRTFPVFVSAKVELHGVSRPDQVVLLPASFKPMETPVHEEDLGMTVVHVYELRNAGPSSVKNALLNISWPVRSGDNFTLYPVEKATEGPIRCSLVAGTINPLGLQLKPLWKEQDENFTKERPHDLHRREVKTEHQGDFPPVMDCGNSECVRLTCTVGQLNKAQIAVLQLRSRLWTSTFIQHENQKFSLEGEAQFEITSFPYLIQPEDYPSGHVKVETVVTWNNTIGQPAPAWVIAVAVLAGLLLLAFLIFMMWKLGFFKRVRPPQGDVCEEQQLHTDENGGEI